MAKRFYSTAKLSERISETPEGFLICEGVPITRAGDLMYSPSETPITAGAGATTISRSIEDIHDPVTIASFEGKPVTINHPDDFVTPDNWRELAVGIVQNVRPGEGEDADKLLADLLITDRGAISAIKGKLLREVSCGYEADYFEESAGKGRQENIIGNHVALVAAGRCGSECAIFDHAPKKEVSPMKTMKQKLLERLGIVLDEAMPEEKSVTVVPAADEDVAATLAAVKARLDAIMARLDAIEASMKPTRAKADAEIVPAKADPEADPEADPAAVDAEIVPAEAEADPVAKRLGLIEAAIAKILGIEEAEPAGQMDVCKDSDTIARAEILAPGIAKTADVKHKAIDAAYGTVDGKAVIDILLAGKTLDKADKDALFVSASELLKGSRREKLSSSQVSLDSLPAMKEGVMTPEMINLANAARYNKP
jgi:uncharacterized protein